jgi:hypothetical protein
MNTVVLSELCRACVLVTLIAAVVGKIGAFSEFQETLRQLFPRLSRGTRGTALGVIALEAILALLLAVGGTAARAGAAAALLLFAAFSAVILSALIRRRVIRCNCFGGATHVISAYDIARNAVLIAACGFYLRESPSQQGLPAAASLGLLGAAVALFLLPGQVRAVLHRLRAADDAPLTLPLGSLAPRFDGRRLLDGGLVSSSDPSSALVLIFLSPACPACRKALPELVRLLPGVRSSGIAFWIACADSAHDIDQLVGGTPLRQHALTLDDETRARLNPRNAASVYLFIDDEMIVQASNYIGDDDWLSFVEQMREAALVGEAASPTIEGQHVTAL